MPTPRSHGGAELVKLPLNLPAGFQGLNTQVDGAVLGFEWATVLRNTVLDSSTRIAARKGWLRKTQEGAGPGVEMMGRLFEYQNHNGARVQLATSVDNLVWASFDEGLTWEDVTGDAAIIDPFLQWINYKDFAFGFQEGGEVIKFDGAVCSDFNPPETVDPSSIAQNRVALSAFGRIWAVDASGTFLQYSALFDENDWNFADPTSDAGGFELKNVWEGTDTVQALVEFNGQLVVFGRDNIIIWSDGLGSAVGLDPLSMYVVDTIHGVGCLARDSVVEVDGELMWLSDSGVHRLSRVVEQRSNPMLNFSQHVHDDIMLSARNTNHKQIQALYSPEERFVVWAFPDGVQGQETGRLYCFDSRGANADGSGRCIGVWDTLVPKCMVRMEPSNEILMFCGVAAPEPPEVGYSRRTFTENVAGVYEGYSDPRNSAEDDTVPYNMVYESAWNNLDSPYIKIPKRFRGIFYTIGKSDANFNVWYDFDKYKYKAYPKEIIAEDSGGLYTNPVDGAGAPAPVVDGTEWTNDPGGVNDQLGVGGEWSGAYRPVIVSIPSVQGTGEYVKLGVSIKIKGLPMAMQELSLYLKQGRLI